MILKLITPHGDWKPRWFTKSSTISCASLPLMGIGNKRTGCISLPCISLPLMGIGNAGLEPESGPPQITSLPLMGIGNFLPADKLRQPVEHLITPHGDWKLRRRLLLARSRHAHYPSWGLETRCRRPPGAPMDRWPTHYPSWGLETSSPSTSLVCSTVSLPLMGIGNTACSCTFRLPVEAHYPSWGLETRCPARRSPSATWSHYPSWGLETF